MFVREFVCKCLSEIDAECISYFFIPGNLSLANIHLVIYIYYVFVYLYIVTI